MDITKFPYKTKPYRHQLQFLLENCDEESFALFWEQGVGKTKPVIDNFFYLLNNQKVNALLVIAPNGVHRNWISDEIPIHLPEYENFYGFAFHSSKSNTRKGKEGAAHLFKTKKVPILVMSYGGIMTNNGKNLVKRFLTNFDCLYVLDESQKIKNKKAKRTKRIVASGKYAKYKRILSGTPISQGAFDVYAQLEFLNPLFWKQNGFPNYTVFKSHFGVWFTRAESRAIKGYDPGYDQLKGYRNLDQLNQLVARMGNRLEKSQVLDLPDKVYKKAYFDLNKEQRAVYNELKEEYLYEYENGELVDASLAITRILRLRQVSCGYLPFGDGEKPVLITEKNPRIELLKSLTEDHIGQGIIWCAFRKDVDLVMDALGDQATRYDGSVSDDQCYENQDRFKKGEFKWIVATSKAAEGLTWTVADLVIYYSNNHYLDKRLQSEDRSHRIGTKKTVLYIDIVANGTPDEKIITNLRNKRSVSREVMGDEFKEWI